MSSRIIKDYQDNLDEDHLELLKLLKRLGISSVLRGDFDVRISYQIDEDKDPIDILWGSNG